MLKKKIRFRKENISFQDNEKLKHDNEELRERAVAMYVP
jgi:hypothetical protein